MLQGLYTAASGMLALEQRHDIVANNIANASTSGYKRLQPVQLGFYSTLTDTLHGSAWFNAQAAPAGGVKVVETFGHQEPGALRSTSNPLNLALQGPGFFVVDTPQGERYTRSGDFTLDASGHLATPEGYKVLSISGQPLDVRGADVNVARDGTVTVDGFAAGQLRLTAFAEPERLEREGANLYRAGDEMAAEATAADGTAVAQQSLEQSNVNVVQEMSAMMLGLRAYEANQRVVAAFDETVSRMIEQIGMPS